MAEQSVDLITHNLSFTLSVYYTNQIPGHIMQLFPKNPSCIVTFPIVKAELAKFDLAIKLVKANKGT